MKRNFITVGMVLLFGGMFVYGFGTDESQLVLKKAIAICMECIGIG